MRESDDVCSFAGRREGRSPRRRTCGIGLPVNVTRASQPVEPLQVAHEHEITIPFALNNETWSSDMAAQSTIERIPGGWRIHGAALVMELDEKTGSPSGLVIDVGTPFTWTTHACDVSVRDDLLRFEFDHRDLAHVRFDLRGNVLDVEKHFRGAPWHLHEQYRLDQGAIAWHAELVLASGDFRSCAVSYRLPWPQPLHGMKFWAARSDMPSAPERFAEIALEYGEVTSGILMPALCSYLESPNAGLLVTMPFDFKTPRFSFVSDFRAPDLVMRFDWKALAPGRRAQARLLFRGTQGSWRPALGWLYERYKEYFEPRSTLTDKLWGGHVCGSFDAKETQVRTSADLGLAWYEIHGHFTEYGNYYPAESAESRSGHERQNTAMSTADKMRQTIRHLHAVGAAAIPYIQVSGNLEDTFADSSLAGSSLRNLHGDLVPAYPKTHLMNSDPSLPYGKHITRQIERMVKRYPEIDGVFVDQLCYNMLDTGHDDGITAVNNRPAYMTGFNYFPHLEHLSSLLHPHRAIIGNGPFGIGVMPYVDGFMAENDSWLCDHFQYLALVKPMFFYMKGKGDRYLEFMFQQCLLYGAGYTSFPWAAPSKDLYRKYVPVLARLFRRRWVFDAQPIGLPVGFQGNVFRGATGSYLASIVSQEPRLAGRGLADNSIYLRCGGIEGATRVTLHCPGETEQSVPFKRENGALQFDVPGNTVAAVAEVHTA